MAQDPREVPGRSGKTGAGLGRGSVRFYKLGTIAAGRDARVGDRWRPGEAASAAAAVTAPVACNIGDARSRPR